MNFLYVSATSAALGAFLFGYNTGVIAGALSFIKTDFNLTTTTAEFVVGSVILGAAVGTAGGGKLSDRFGRRTILVASAPIFAVGALASALAPSVIILILSRCFVGLAIGLSSATVPVYLSEIAPASSRGWMVSLFQLFITLGILTAYLVAYLLSGIQGWRWMVGLSLLPAVVFGALTLSLPESPRWLVGQGNLKNAHDVLARIRSIPDVKQELQMIEESLALQSHTGRWADLLNTQIRPALLIGVFLAVFQQVTGINTVIYYAPRILRIAGFASESNAILVTAGIGLVNVVATIAAMQLVDRVGRRVLLLCGSAAMALSLGIMGLAFRVSERSGQLDKITAFFLMVYVASFAISLGPVFWLLISEIYPLKVRGLAEGAAATLIWVSDSVVVLTYLTLIERLGTSWTFFLYASLCVALLIFVWFCVPETKGLTLEQIEGFWRQRDRS